MEFCAAGDFVPVLECDMAGLPLVFDEAMVNLCLVGWSGVSRRCRVEVILLVSFSAVGLM